MSESLTPETERIIRGHWTLRAQAERDSGATLLALWGGDERDRAGGFLLRAAYLGENRLRVLELALDDRTAAIPGIADIFPAAARMERALHDLLGLRTIGSDPRPWLRHTAWPDDAFPLHRDFVTAAPARIEPDAYPFVPVEGDGVHEIPVGPVHAGIIEPGHFRFSVVGEKVLRLEQRLGFVHKGIEKRFEQLSPGEGQRLAARISGDSAVAYAWAYCQALETLAGARVPPRAAVLRALLLERERIANHLGDLGALGNDAGFGLGLAQFMRLKEDLLRANQLAFDARYPMDAVVPGGVARAPDDAGIQTLRVQTETLERELRELRAIYDEHAGIQDRFRDCGIVSPALARQLGLLGLAGRASGQARDLRRDLPCPPYDRLQTRIATQERGDVAARVAVRFDELFESLRLCRELLRTSPHGEIRASLPRCNEGIAYGVVEGWRGPVFVALEIDGKQRIRRCHAHDPSWQNWPVLEHAVIGNIVPDFPLINKSFNLSYSGHDL